MVAGSWHHRVRLISYTRRKQRKPSEATGSTQSGSLPRKTGKRQSEGIRLI